MEYCKICGIHHDEDCPEEAEGEYTKGEWEIIEANNGTFFLRDSVGVEICEYIRGKANAHLIAQAPKMYEAIEAAIVEIEDGSSNHAHLILCNALAKVKG